jgi:hypothetical protein
MIKAPGSGVRCPPSPGPAYLLDALDSEQNVQGGTAGDVEIMALKPVES